MSLTRIAVALIWTFTMLGASGVVSLAGGSASASAFMKDKDKEDHGGGNGNGGEDVDEGSDDDAGEGDDAGEDLGDGSDEVEETESWVTICHATGSGSYNEISVNVNATEGGHGNHAGDIIPAPAGGCPADVDDGTDEDGTEDDGTDDGTNEDETDGDETDDGDEDGGEKTEVVVDLDENGQGTISFDLDGDGTVDFTIVIGEDRASED